jgi:hypothetical protein
VVDRSISPLHGHIKVVANNISQTRSGLLNEQKRNLGSVDR